MKAKMKVKNIEEFMPIDGLFVMVGSDKREGLCETFGVEYYSLIWL
ncbi:hypothetical protein Hanom_Chr17g01556711 [Helianthus anomalus]